LIGWLIDTNVVASLMAPNGAPSVKAWGQVVDEDKLFLSVLTLAEYDKGIANLADDDPSRPRHIATRDALEARFQGRILPLGNQVVRRWGEISGRVKRETGHPPPVIDTLLAATAIEADLYLVSRNVRDLRRSGASIFDPWSDDPAGFPLNPATRRGRQIDLD
jgi:predicted nucleic acid-binding protein